jgi:hypothetical protein
MQWTELKFADRDVFYVETIQQALVAKVIKIKPCRPAHGQRVK